MLLWIDSLSVFFSKFDMFIFYFMQKSMCKEPQESKVCIYAVICIVSFGFIYEFA